VYDEAVVQRTLMNKNVEPSDLQQILDEKLGEVKSGKFSHRQLKDAQEYWVKYSAWEYNARAQLKSKAANS